MKSYEDTSRRTAATSLILLILCIGTIGCSPAAEDAPSDAVSQTAANEEPPASVGPAAMGTLEAAGEDDGSFAALFAEDTATVLADGFEWSEGPVWLPKQQTLLFSDVPTNRIYRWNETDGLGVWLEPSGYTGDVPRGGEPGSNGLFLDAAGDLLLCQHGDRRVARLKDPGSMSPDREAVFETLADRYDGKRFHSPNDLVVHSNGDVYFTDPPYGLEGGPDGPGREMEFQGVYRVTPEGEVTLIASDLSRPNGIALSADEKTLYVANSDPEHAVWMAYELNDDGSAGPGRLFFDATTFVSEDRPGLPDGLVVDAEGRLFATGPGGVWVFSKDGEHLGTLRLPVPAANCTLGEDGASLLVTADLYLLRIRLAAHG